MQKTMQDFVTNTNVITQESTLTDYFVIQPNPKFDILPSNGITVLRNSPISTSYSEVSHATNLGQTASFQFRVGEGLFLSRDVLIKMTIPVRLTFTTPLATAPTEASYMGLCNSFRNIAWRQYGILAGIQGQDLKLNNQPILTLQNMYKILEMTSEYYDKEEVDRNFPASQPDRFSNYDLYDDSVTPLPITTVSESRKLTKYQTAVLNDENIFTGGYSSAHNSRKPLFTFIGADTTYINLEVTSYCYLPFSIFSLPSSPFSLYGVNDFALDLYFKPKMVSEMFVLNGTLFSSVDADYSNAPHHKTSIEYKTYNAPDYIQKAMRNPDGGVKPYRINLSSIEYLPPIALTGIAGNASVSTSTLQYTPGIVPSAVYLSIHAVKNAATPWKTPNFKARISQITCRGNGHETTISDSAIRVLNLARSNGLTKDYSSSMYSNGFVVKLDLSKDISLGGLLIGTNIQTDMTFGIIFDNLCDQQTDYELRTAVVYNSQVRYQDRAFGVVRALVLSQMNYDISNQAADLYSQLNKPIMTIGGSWIGDAFGSLGRLVKRGWEYAKENPHEVLNGIIKVGKTLAGAGPQANNIIGGSTMMLGAGAPNSQMSTYGAGNGVRKSPFK